MLWVKGVKYLFLKGEKVLDPFYPFTFYYKYFSVLINNDIIYSFFSCFKFSDQCFTISNFIFSPLTSSTTSPPTGKVIIGDV